MRRFIYVGTKLTCTACDWTVEIDMPWMLRTARKLYGDRWERRLPDDVVPRLRCTRCRAKGRLYFVTPPEKEAPRRLCPHCGGAGSIADLKPPP